MPPEPPTAATPDKAASRHSPCIGVCDLDTATGWCRGCGRAREEIAGWIEMSDAERLSVWDGLSTRLDALGVRARLMPWTSDELAAWVVSTLSEAAGTWATGVPGAVAEFPLAPEREIETAINGTTLVARASDARFRLHLHDKLRAFAFGAGKGPVVLALPRARITVRAAPALVSLGPDTAAIDPEHREDQLFDLAIARLSSRFCVRTRDPELMAALAALEGAPLPRVLKDAGPLLLGKSPHRIVESALARIEVFAPIPAPDAIPTDGAHSHLLPQLLQTGEETPAALSLPSFALPVAIYYPR